MRTLQTMRAMRTRTRALIFATAIALAALWPTGCDSDPAGPLSAPAGPSAAFGIWEPGPNDTCSKEIHDRYAVVGPDGKLYPTWHPPVDPATGCSFGHEHGRDPRGSKLYREVGPIPFGYANEQLDIYAPHMRRHEDHVGHKIEWENDFELSFENGGNAVLRVTCSVLTKLHQGSHSKDAFTNNLHELVYHIRCNDGTAMHVTIMAAIGEPGVFHASCDRDRRIHAGDPTPLNSPRGSGKRVIPDRACIEQHMLVSAGTSNYHTALRESWETFNTIRTASGRTLATFDPYYQILFPSRYYDPTQPNNLGRPIDVCYEVAPNGARARGGECERSTANGQIPGVMFDDPRSAFNGVLRFVDINATRIDNADGPEVWYTDPFGQNARTEPFPGSIRQWIARIDNSGTQGKGPNIGRNRNYGGPGVHAPN